jgi:hypothetical protein
MSSKTKSVPGQPLTDEERGKSELFTLCKHTKPIERGMLSPSPERS